MSQPADFLAAFEVDIQRRVQAEEAWRRANATSDPHDAQLRAALADALQMRDEVLRQEQLRFEDLQQQTAIDFDHRLSDAQREHEETLQSIESGSLRASQQLEQQRSDSAWIVSSVMDDTAEDSPARVFERFKSLLQKSREDQTAEWEQLNQSIATASGEKELEPPSAGQLEQPPRDREEAALRFNESTAAARQLLKKWHSLILPRLVRGFRSVILFLMLLGSIAGPIFLYVDPQTFGIPDSSDVKSRLIFSAVAGGIGSLLLTLVIATLASMRQSEIFRQLMDVRAEVYRAHQHWLKFAKEQLALQQRDFEQQQRKIERDREGSLSRFQRAHEQKLQEIRQEQAERTQVERRRYAEQHAMLSAARREALTSAQAEHRSRLSQLEQEWSQRIDQAQSALDTYAAGKRKTLQEHWVQLKSDWDRGRADFEGNLQQLRTQAQRQFASWTDLAAGQWAPPREIPTAIRLGEFDLDLSQWPGAVSDDPRLAPRITRHRIPVTVPFPAGTSVLFQSPQAAARSQAVAGLQCLMLRLLTLLPPGKLRFTIIDPVGLGESFSGFMHLADYDELLVTSRIWTEANQIEARLADLTEHMENVLQKYLRNEFQTIEEYNESAGEVAEPYHVLVISDFPAKFSEIAARRLVSIVNSGPRCGVYTLLNCDISKQLPNNFQLADVVPRMTRLYWREGAFHLPERSLTQIPLQLDAPPAAEEFTAIVKMVGEASKDARRVEVSFSRIAPTADQIWASDSRSELVIPLGRAGATKLQQLRLGKGTSQHMLVAGKTGSGKSTFLHILITNLALHYSPDEVNFILIDFKKGVEFKDYATYQMPHARIIAVESDREFGVSALMRLGDVLQERGELFRRHGVQDIAGYRNSTGRPLPRILLVVDEFQEFFVEDDKISQNAALLLDRLVRQGRAFGIHIILGSQTLGGAYSLARSTLGQVAVRVALQCSEADAHLILSEENTAARLLTRPGEAIYNDANGMMEGNHPFQIAWITDEERESALREFLRRQKMQSRHWETPIVFEGNIPSDLAQNSDLSQLIREYSQREQPLLTPTLWLGDAVEIAPATALTLHRQSGSHLLLVGQDADAALGVMSAAFITICASLSPQQEWNSVFVLDGSHAGTVEADAWHNLVETLPVDARLIRPPETAPFLQAMTAELERREADNDTASPPIVLLIFNIARFRDLRKSEDEFGLGSFGSNAEKGPDPGKQFADLLSRGPAFGIHAIIWCDSSNNLERWFSRQTLRELELRIAFQMNASDSSNYIDTPAASRLGTHRALLHREETGTSEKFRPYGLASPAWLAWVRQQMLSDSPVEFVSHSEQTEPEPSVPEPAAAPEPDTPDLEEFSIQ